MNSYELSRKWFDYSFENPERIKPVHTSIYFFAIEHCNRLGWKEKFGLPTSMVMEAVGVKSYNTYIKSLNDIVGFGFIKMIEKSKNQYSSNIVALSNFNKALDKALDKALIKHGTKQSESTVQSIDSIIKQINNKQITIEQVTIEQNNFLLDFLLKKQNQKKEKEAYDFLKESSPVKIESFEMQNKKSFPDYEKFIENFNNKVVMEKLEFDSDILLARLRILNTNWDKKPKNAKANTSEKVIKKTEKYD